MSSPSDKKLHGLDHLRALAIVLVFFYHYSVLFPHPKWMDTYGRFGWIGVDLFFVLSGFLIANHLFEDVQNKKTVPLKQFYLKRFFRIVPAYITVVIIYFSIPVFREWEALSPLWKYLTFTQNLGLDLRHNRTFSHAWSLCIEEQFYLLFPLLLFALLAFKPGKKILFILPIVFLLTFFARFITWGAVVEPLNGTPQFGVTWAKWIYYPTWCRLDGLIVGISIAAVFRFLPKTKEYVQRFYLLFLFAGLAILTGAYYICEQQATFQASTFGFSLVALGFGCITVSALSPSSFMYKYHSRFTVFIATLSYSVYLLHKGLIHLSQEFCEHYEMAEDSTIAFLLSIAGSLAGAGALYLVIEKPFLKLRRHLSGN
ncbi:MAG: acyltransferase 3 [Bacteroidetes bacterium]|jgi:peptidoglycan/LPS O-acetylase OafA/YrhL|nr:acyltransferase 3 [Bacteroidota bacterium]